jgi:hypothetical protein
VARQTQLEVEVRTLRDKLASPAPLHSVGHDGGQSRMNPELINAKRIQDLEDSLAEEKLAKELIEKENRDLRDHAEKLMATGSSKASIEAIGNLTRTIEAQHERDVAALHAQMESRGFERQKIELNLRIQSLESQLEHAQQQAASWAVRCP